MTKYRIYELSARAVMSYAVAEGEQLYVPSQPDRDGEMQNQSDIP